MAEDLNIRWVDGLSVGHAALDAEHRQFLDHLKRLEEASADDGRWAEAASLAHKIAEDMLTHFAHEELILEKYSFPGLAAHRETHARLAKSVGQLCALAASPLSLAERRHNVIEITHALVTHFLGCDMQFKSFLVEAMDKARRSPAEPPCPWHADCPGCFPSETLALHGGR